MLSAEKAKFKSAFERTKSQMHKERMLNRQPIQTRGVKINLIINCTIFRKLKESDTAKEFIADFKKSWFIVSQALVRAMRNRIKNRPSFTGLPSFLCCSAKQIWHLTG